MAFPLRDSTQEARIVETAKELQRVDQMAVDHKFSLPCAGITQIKFGGCDLSPNNEAPLVSIKTSKSFAEIVHLYLVYI